jgi:hypothetical protein
MWTDQEFARNCLEFFDFAVEAAKVYKKRCPEKSFSDILKTHTMFPWSLRSSTSECKEYPAEALTFLAEADEDLDGAAAKFRPAMEKIALRNSPLAQVWNPHFKPGMSLRWDGPHPSLPDNICIVHMWNGIAPKSFLNEPRYLAENFIEILDDSQKHHPFDTLRTFSWLNSSPRYLAFFPQEWQDNLCNPHPDVYANMGFLGQFVTADGRLNKKTAQSYLESGKLPFIPRESHCSYEALREHLYKNFLKG